MNAPILFEAPPTANGDAEHETPTAADPLRGLPHLAKVARLGRDLILEMASAPVPYVWLYIAVAATIVVIAGFVGEGKTTLLFLILAARMNTGDAVSVLGRRVEPAPQGTWIVLIEAEHGEGSTSRKLVKSCALLGINDAALDRIIIIARRSVLIGSPEWCDVVALIATGLVSDIALDTIARVTAADGNAEQEQVAIFNVIAEAIDAAPTEATKPTVWVAAHTKKNATGDLSDVSGSTQRTGQADSVLLVKGERVDGRIVSSTVTFAKLREDPDDFPTPVKFAIVKDEHGVARIYLHDAIEDDADAPLEGRILDQLTLGPKTKTALATKLGRSSADVEAAITTLFEARRIATTSMKVNGRDRKAFTLRADFKPAMPTAPTGVVT